MDADEIEDLRQLLAAHRQTLTILLRQVAKQGEAHAQPAQISGIAEARAAIARLKQAIRAEGVEVSDAPNDQVPADWAASTQPAEEAQIINADIVGVVNARGADMSRAECELRACRLAVCPRNAKRAAKDSKASRIAAYD